MMYYGGDTLVETQYGIIPLERLDPGDLIYTPAGFAEVEGIGWTKVSNVARIQLVAHCAAYYRPFDDLDQVIPALQSISRSFITKIPHKALTPEELAVIFCFNGKYDDCKFVLREIEYISIETKLYDLEIAGESFYGNGLILFTSDIAAPIV